MNLFLFSDIRETYRIEGNHPWAMHVRQVLRIGAAGGIVAIGVENGPRGLAYAREGPHGEWTFAVKGFEPVSPASTELEIALPYLRPGEAKRIFREAATLGVSRIHWFPGVKSARGYADARLWKNREAIRNLLREGAMQGYHTRLPEIIHHDSLDSFLANPGGSLVALDPYTAPQSLAAESPRKTTHTLVFGGERGFHPTERNKLHVAGAVFRHLGPRILRTDTAVIAAISITQAITGALQDNQSAVIDISESV